MKTCRLMLVVALFGLAACGREGRPLVGTQVTSAPHRTSAPSTETPQASPTPTQTPEATETAMPPLESASPTLETASPTPSSPGTGRSGVYGSVVHGPVCSRGQTDCEGRPLHPVLVKARNQDGGDDGSATTDAEGKFSIPLQPGTYFVGVSTRSYSRCDQEAVEVRDGFYTPVHLTCDHGG